MYLQEKKLSHLQKYIHCTTWSDNKMENTTLSEQFHHSKICRKRQYRYP